MDHSKFYHFNSLIVDVYVVNKCPMKVSDDLSEQCSGPAQGRNESEECTMGLKEERRIYLIYLI